MEPWPFQYFVTGPMLLHTQDFLQVDSLLLLFPTLSRDDDGGDSSCVGGGGDDGDACSDLMLEFSQQLAKASSADVH